MTTMESVRQEVKLLPPPPSRQIPRDSPFLREGHVSDYNDANTSETTMRLGPTTNRQPRSPKHERPSCSKCKVAFSSFQVIKINNKQLCIWCAGHPVDVSSRSFTLGKSTNKNPGTGAR